MLQKLMNLSPIDNDSCINDLSGVRQTKGSKKPRKKHYNIENAPKINEFESHRQRFLY